MTFTVGSLFSGIGGLELGLERAGFETRWQSEVNPYCSRVLAKHWPNIPNLGDVTKIDWSTVERVDLICGGYPCQPFSLAGARRGEQDDRHLWPHMRDAIRVLRPRLALLENVPGHFSLGFGTVLGDLAEIGYDAEWDCIPAAAVGAPHLRWRLFVVAYPSGERRQQEPRGAPGDEGAHAGRPATPDHELECDGQGGRGAAMADADRAPGHAARPPGEAVLGPGAVERLGRCGSSLGEQWTVEPQVGRVAYGIPARVDRLRALGNAVVPQVAQFIGEQLIQYFEAA